MILGIWGDDKTTKTTTALTAPRPIFYQEFDIGGFRRANRNIGDNTIKEWYEAGQITHKKYIMPFQLGDIDPVKNIIRPSKIIVGIKELWYQWLADYMMALKSDKYESIVIDTGTLLWEITNTCYLQEKQEQQLPLRADGKGQDGKPLRTQLQQIEYKEPNIRMRSITYQAQAHEKNLVMTHHSRDEYGIVKLRDGSYGEGRTGRKERNGWSALGDSADVILQTWIKEDKKANTITPMATVTLAEVQELVGMEFENPTFDKIAGMIKLIKGES